MDVLVENESPLLSLLWLPYQLLSLASCQSENTKFKDECCMKYTLNSCTHNIKHLDLSYKPTCIALQHRKCPSKLCRHASFIVQPPTSRSYIVTQGLKLDHYNCF